jgi:type IV secretory pathway TraG/TraD family ATPase VirD4
VDARIGNSDQRRVTIGTDEKIDFSIEDLCRHTIIFGNSGSGKTTRAFNPMLLNTLEQFDCGALIIAAKADAVFEVTEIAKRTGREYIVVQPGSQFGIDLLTGSPDVDAMYFRDTFGRVPEDQAAWIDAAVTRMKNALHLLKSVGPQYYNFEFLTQYVFDEHFAAHIRISAQERLRSLTPDSEEAWAINQAISYEEKRFRTFTPEARKTIEFSVSQLLEPMMDVHIARTFARRSNLFSIDGVFSGKIVILHVPRARYERAAAAIYTLAKRRFFTAIENRRANQQLDQTRPVLFAVDEYQLCISETDVQSLGIIRSAGCMVLATTQGVSSLYSVLPSYKVDAALQNFTQKIFFKTDDEATLEVLRRSEIRHNGVDSGELLSMNRDQALCHVTSADTTKSAMLTLDPLFILPPPTMAGTGIAVASEEKAAV